MKLDNDILLIDKPKGISSFDCIRILRQKLNIKKMGHAGTLDPLATGLLIIGIGNGTKKLTKLIGLRKTYDVDILLGERTTTGDLEGEVIEEAVVGNISDSKIKKIFTSMEGEIVLPVPLYSAIKKKGKPLYKYARMGKKVELPVKNMKVYSISFINFQKIDKYAILTATMNVGSGVYIRSLVEEFGKRVGVPATVKDLRRTKIGEFDVQNAITIDKKI